jgi:hypothetical protein
MDGKASQDVLVQEFSEKYDRTDRANAWYGSVGQFAGREVLVQSDVLGQHAKPLTGQVRRVQSTLGLGYRTQITGVLTVGVLLPELTVSDMDITTTDRYLSYGTEDEGEWIEYAHEYSGPVLAMQLSQGGRKPGLIPVSVRFGEDDDSWDKPAWAYLFNQL